MILLTPLLFFPREEKIQTTGICELFLPRKDKIPPEINAEKSEKIGHAEHKLFLPYGWDISRRFSQITQILADFNLFSF